jgi:hypothetical protein
MKRPLTPRAGQAAGDLEQPAAHGPRNAHGLAGEPDHAGPAQQVVRDGGDDCPGAVGVELAGGEVRERLVFQVADRELDDGVLAVLSLDDLQGSVRLVMNGKYRQSGHSSACGPMSRVRRTISRRP